MGRLVDLPSELLVHIINFAAKPDDGGHGRHHVPGPTLYALSLTCREFSHVAKAMLLRFLVFDVRDNRNEPSLDKGYICLQRFVKVCEQFPYLVDLIEAMCIWWERRRPDYTLEGGRVIVEERSYLERLIVCLARSTKLKTLQLVLDDSSALQTLTARPDHLKSAFPTLCQLKIGDRGAVDYLIDEEAFVGLCVLPSLTHLELHRSPTPRPGSQFRSTNLETLTSRLQSLECWGSWFTPDSIQFVLSRSPHLRVLVLPTATASYTRCRFRSVSNSADRTANARSSCENSIDSTLSWVLKPVKSTLEHLFIRDTRKVGGGFNAGLLDLSDFASLRIAELPDYILTQHKTRGSTHPLIRPTNLLPPALEILNIRFAIDRGVFSTADDRNEVYAWKSYERLSSACETQMPEWFKDICYRDKSILPNLRIVRAYEEPHPDIMIRTAEWNEECILGKRGESATDFKFIVRIPRELDQLPSPFRETLYGLEKTLERH